LAHSAVGRAQEALDQVGIGVAKKGGIMRPMVVAGQERALEVDPKDRRVSPDLRGRHLKLGDQNVRGGGDQREQLTSSAVLPMESPGRTDGVTILAVRGPSTAVIVDIDQPGAENVPRAVENIGVRASELTPAIADPCGQDAIVSESDEGAGAVEAGADQPD